MKCPQCRRDHKAKYGLACACGYQFVFDPKTDTVSFGFFHEKLTDGKWLAILNRASRNDTTYFTKPQLYAAYNRQFKDSLWPSVCSGAIFLIITAGVSWFGVWLPYVIFGGAALVLALFGAIRWAVFRSRGANRERFEEHLAAWQKKRGPLPRLITAPELHDPPPEWDEADIYDYGVERLLIVERDILVDLFVRNGFHAEQRTLIVSETGYPEYLMPRAELVLRERADLPVFLLHDSHSEGKDMESRLRASERFPLDHHPIVDLGLFPGDLRHLKHARKLSTERDAGDFPIDLIAYGFLSAAMADALVNRTVLGTLLEQRVVSGDASVEYG